MKKQPHFKMVGWFFPALLVSLLVLSSCAHSESVQACVSGEPYGFWGGLWHGIIAPFGFLGMLLDSETAMYASNNNGAWYALGFLLGSGGWGILAGSRGRRKG